MAKFVIIDQSLLNLTGHHYEYDVSVAEAAQRLGYEPIIVSHKKFPKHLHPKEIKTIPIFTQDWAGRSLTDDSLVSLLINWVKILIESQFNPKIKIRAILKIIYDYLLLSIPFLKPLVFKLKISLLKLKPAIKSDIIKLLIPIYLIIKFLLKIKEIAILFLPVKTFIWSLNLIKELAKGVAKLIQKTLIFGIRKSAQQKQTFTKGIKLAFKEITPLSGDHVFIHTIGVEQLEELFNFVSTNNCDNPPHYHILLRRDCNEPVVTNAKGIGLKACINRFYGSRLYPDLVTFYTDTEELTKQHNALSHIRFITAPIPFRHENLQERSTLSSTHTIEPINIVYLGDARPEKGYQYLPMLVDSLWFDYVQPGKVKFTIQSNFNLPNGEPGMQEARLQLEQYPSHQVKILKEPLSTEAYYNLLARADIVVIPYLPESYAARSSGVLVESLAAGKPVVVPANSWMATQVDETRASIYSSPNQIADAVLRILNNFQQYSQYALDYSLFWRFRHSPDALVKCLLKQDILVKKTLDRAIPSIVYIIDADSIVNKVGSGQVARNHLDYLCRCGYMIYGIFFFYDAKISDEEFVTKVFEAQKILASFNVLESWFLRYKFPLISQFGENLTYIKSRIEAKPNLKSDLLGRSYLEIPTSLVDFLKTQKIDAVFLNYIQSWSIIEKLGLDKYPVVCEMHDIQSHQYALYNNREIDAQEFDLECKLLDKCDVVLANNLKELEKVKEFVTKSSLYKVPYIGRLLPPKFGNLAGCLNLAEVVIAGGVKNPQAFRENDHLQQQSSIDILYVSSHHYPNVYSLKWFFHKVYMPYLADKGINFVIAGNIMNRGDLGEISHPNIFTTGTVETLEPLYAATRLVILPIKMGAGFNIKTIEALAMGKPIVATSVALRGIEFDKNIFPCCNEPEEFANKILELLASEEARLDHAKKGYQIIQGRYDQIQYDKAMNLALKSLLGEQSLLPNTIVPTTEREPYLVEWSPEIQAFNRILNQLLNQQSVSPKDCTIINNHISSHNLSIYQELYSVCINTSAEKSIDKQQINTIFSTSDEKNEFDNLVLPKFNDLINLIKAKAGKFTSTNHSLIDSKQISADMQISEFKYKHSYLDYYDSLTNYDLFADILSRILKQYLVRDELRLGFVGFDSILTHLAYSLSEHCYVINGFFAGENKTGIHPQKSIELLNPENFDVIFLAEDAQANERNYVNLICKNIPIRVVELPQIVTSHFQVLMSVDRGKFISCLNHRKLAVISLCNALAPKQGCFVECGVYLGGTTIYISKHSEYLGINRKIYALDTYEGMPQPVTQDGDTLFQAGLFSDNQLDRVAAYYKAHNVMHKIKMVKGLVQDTLPNLDFNEPIALALLDMDQYAGTSAALNEVIPRLHPDGIIVLDDVDLDGVDIAIKEALKLYPNIARMKIVQGFDILYNKDSSRSFAG